MDLRHGTNPHQRARIVGPSALIVRHGVPSCINLLDALSAWPLVHETADAIRGPVAASFKHVSPAGAATAGHLDDAAMTAWGLSGAVGPLTAAYIRARDADPKSSFGDMIAVSDPVDAELADFLSRVVSDGIVAPGFEPGTVASLARKKRGTFLVLEADPGFAPPRWESRDVFGTTLEQERDRPISSSVLPDGLPRWAMRDCLLGLMTVRYTQSNSVALIKDGAALAIGSGQQNRVDCVRLAAGKAATWWLRRSPSIQAMGRPRGIPRQDWLNWQIRVADGDMTAGQRSDFAGLFPGHDACIDAPARSAWLERLSGATLVSDGYLPFRDNIEQAHRIGVRCVVEPGGSVRSDDVAAACDEAGMTLIRTGLRLFHH
ncbi:MAG: hypothetical protein ACR2F6_00245 [Mycobacteriales bacterium]